MRFNACRKRSASTALIVAKLAHPALVAIGARLSFDTDLA